MFGLIELYFKCIHIFVMSESFFEWLILIITYFTPVKSRITPIQSLGRGLAGFSS